MRYFVLLCALLGSVSTARASDQFVSVFAGEVSDPSVHFTVPAPGNGIDFDSGYDINAVFGRHFGPIRVELSGFYQSHKARGHAFDGIQLVSGVLVGNVVPATGSVDAYGGMLGAYYEFASGWPRFTPYIGGALGYGHAEFDVTAGNTQAIKSGASALALRAVLGSSYRLNDRASLFVEGGYHRLGSLDVTAFGQKQNVTLESWGAGLGVRINL